MIMIPANMNRANDCFLRLAKRVQQKMRTEQAYPNSNNRRKQFQQSIQFNPPPLNLNSRNNTLGNTRKRTPNTR